MDDEYEHFSTIITLDPLPRTSKERKANSYKSCITSNMESIVICRSMSVYNFTKDHHHKKGNKERKKKPKQDQSFPCNICRYNSYDEDGFSSEVSNIELVRYIDDDD